MKKNHLAILALLGSSILTAGYQAFAAPQTLDGVVSDSMCGKKHMMPGKPDAECIRECVKAGSAYVLVAGGKSYTLNGEAAVIARFAGKHVQVRGEIKQNSIDVSSIQDAKPASHADMKM